MIENIARRKETHIQKIHILSNFELKDLILTAVCKDLIFFEETTLFHDSFS